MKKVLSLVLACMLVLGLAAPALADELPPGWTPADGARGVDGGFSRTLTVNGVDVDTSDIPEAEEAMIPARRLCEALDTADYTDWNPEESYAFFYIAELPVVVHFADMSIEVNFEDTGFEAYLDPNGYTFLPIGVLMQMGLWVEFTETGYEIEWSGESLSELAKLAYAIVDATEMGSVMDLTYEPEYMESMGIRAENYDDIVFLYPMMSANPSMVLIGEVAYGAMDAAKEDFEEVRASLMNSMGNYPSSAAAIEAGQIVEAEDGIHLMLVISHEGNDLAIEMFQAAFMSRER